MLSVAQLQALRAVARYRHVTRAAAALGLAQPTVTYHLRELERHLGVRLIEPVGRRIELTAAGAYLAERAAALLNDLDDVERAMRDFASGERGRLRLGATRTVGGYALPAVLAAFHAEHPGIELQLTVDNTQAIERLLLQRAVELAVVEGRIHSPALASRPLRQDTLLLVAPPDHPLTTRDVVQLEDLRGQPFVMREPGSGTGALAEAALGPLADAIDVVLELDQPEAIVRSVEAGMGLTFISETIVARQVVAGTLRVLPLQGVSLTRDFSLVTPRRRPETHAMRAFGTFIARAWAPAGLGHADET